MGETWPTSLGFWLDLTRVPPSEDPGQVSGYGQNVPEMDNVNSLTYRTLLIGARSAQKEMFLVKHLFRGTT